MEKYAQGSEVTIDFEGSFTEGEVFESTYDDAPMCFYIGKGEVLEDIEKTIQTMDIGQTETINIPCEQAYGASLEEKIIKVPKTSLPTTGAIDAGEQIIIRTPEGDEMPAIILSIDEDMVTIDANHPLAGEDITIKITLLSVETPVENPQE